jgi:hypothetical protein
MMAYPSGYATCHHYVMSHLKMKINKTIFILILISLYSCNEKLQDSIIGEWTLVPQNRTEKILEQLKFTVSNEVQVVTEDLFKSSLPYHIFDKEITITTLDTVIKSKLKFVNEDSLILFDSLLYVKNFPTRFSDFPVIHQYKLFGYETEKIIKIDHEYSQILHYYKIDNDIILRGGLTKLQFEDLNLYLEGVSYNNPVITIYIGTNINLADLKKLYFYIGHTGQRHVKLVTNKTKLFEVQYVRDKIEIWWDELQSYSKSLEYLPPRFPPPEEYLRSKSKYLKDDGHEIKITYSDEIDKLKVINKTDKYVISIDQNMALKDYFYLKKTITDKRKINRNIITEIN